jgi:TldD protein
MKGLFVIINPQIISKVLDAALATGADFAEVFLEDTYSSDLMLFNGSPKNAIVGQMYGAGIRLFFDKEQIYVTTNNVTEAGLIKAAQDAASARPANAQTLLKNKPKTALPLEEVTFDQIHVYGNKPWDQSREKKNKILVSLDQEARAVSSLVTQVETRLLEKNQIIQVANSMGVMALEERSYLRIFVTVFVEDQGKKEHGYESTGWLGTFEEVEKVDLKTLAQTAAKTALSSLNAGYAPAGEMPVILNNGFGGVIFHEACGHGLETTSVAKGSSVFCNLLGEKIAHECVTAIDDGTLPNAWGSLCVDDEGRLTQKTVLIENGILKSYLVDELGSRKTGYAPTGSARRQSYKLAPTSRMRNTFIAPGTESLEQMISDVDYGLYAAKMGGGSVSPGTGEYNFSVIEAYVIRNGQLKERVKGASLIGKGIETLGRIVKVGSDLQMANGMCGSISGSIPVTVGQPPLMVSQILVGGRS